MKKLLTFALFSSAMCAQANEYIGISENFKLDLSTPLQSVTEMSQAAKPITKRITKGFEELQSTMKAVQGDPNRLNSAKFEKAYANFVSDLIKDVDYMVTNKESIEYAFEEIKSEISRVVLAIDNTKQKDNMKALALEDAVDKAKKIMQDKARELKRKDKLTPSDKRAIQSLKMAYLQQKKLHEMQLSAVQQSNILQQKLLNRAASLKNGSDLVKNTFQNMQGLRDTLKNIAYMRAKATNIDQEIRNSGIEEAMNTIQDIFNTLGAFNEMSSDIHSTMIAVSSNSGGDIPIIDANAEVDLDELLEL